MGDGAPAAPPRGLLAASVLVVLTGSAVFFAGTAVAPALTDAWDLGEDEAAWLSAAVQAGFIAGTLLAAGLNLPDRVPPGRLLGALLVGAAAANGAFAMLDGRDEGRLGAALLLRFLAGALAGPVYPVGMKLLATWYPRLGWQLGVMLGAYTLGLGVAFALRAAAVPWQPAVLAASALAAAGALLALRLRAGPRLPGRSALDLSAAARAFRVAPFRRVAFAYFGHMWELFAFWALLPFWLQAAGWSPGAAAGLAGAGFAAGAAGCVAAGAWSRRVGEARPARVALAASGLLCLASPLLFGLGPGPLQAGIVLVWAAAVIADSPMFSALSARAAPPGHVGTALTVQNSLGFALTLVPITLLPVFATLPPGSWQWAFLLLAPGPLLGLLPLQKLVRDAAREADEAAAAGDGHPSQSATSMP